MCQQLCIGNKLLLFKVNNWSFIFQGWAEHYNFKTIFPWEKETQMSKKRETCPICGVCFQNLWNLIAWLDFSPTTYQNIKTNTQAIVFGNCAMFEMRHMKWPLEQQTITCFFSMCLVYLAHTMTDGSGIFAFVVPIKIISSTGYNSFYNAIMQH